MATTQKSKEKPFLTEEDENDFLEKGVDSDMAYFKKDLIDNKIVWAIYESSGSFIGQASTPEAAEVIIFQNDMTPVCLN